MLSLTFFLLGDWNPLRLPFKIFSPFLEKGRTASFNLKHMFYEQFSIRFCLCQIIIGGLIFLERLWCDAYFRVQGCQSGVYDT